jgi:hypothetical protein
MLSKIFLFYEEPKKLMKKEKIFHVDEVCLQILKKEPPVLEIIAKGQVVTSGWDLKSGELVPHIYIQLPADGIYEFDFTASPPMRGTRTSDILINIDAKYNWENYPEDLKGVRINSGTNKKVKKIY